MITIAPRPKSFGDFNSLPIPAGSFTTADVTTTVDGIIVTNPKAGVLPPVTPTGIFATPPAPLIPSWVWVGAAGAVVASLLWRKS